MREGYDRLVRKAMHALFGGFSRSLFILAALAALIAVGPFIAEWFGDHGLPGETIVFLGIVIGACSGGFSFFFTMRPRSIRSRALRQLGDELGLPYSKKIRLPRGVRALPSFQLMYDGWTVHDGIEGHRQGGPMLVFARSWSTDGYEPTRWSICAATTALLKAPQLLVGPRHLSVDERPILDQVVFESETFDRIWEVRTDDQLLASTIIDQRMMAWLLGRRPDVSFELRGAWAMAVSHGIDRSAPAALVDALDGFLEHLPHVAISELGRDY